MVQNRWSRTGMFARFSQMLDLTVPEEPLVDALASGALVAVSVDIGELNPLMADGLGDRFRA